MGEEFQDMLGNPVGENRVVAFAKREGNVAEMTVALITEVKRVEKFTGHYFAVKARSYDSWAGRWRAAREINENNVIALPYSRAVMEDMLGLTPWR